MSATADSVTAAVPRGPRCVAEPSPFRNPKVRGRPTVETLAPRREWGVRAIAGTESSSQVIKDSSTSSPSEYSVLESMATSSRSVVYRGKRMSDGATVVLKSFNQGESTSQQRRELELELQTLRQLSSPGVLRGYEVCDIGGLPTLVLEHFGGEALKTPPQGWALEDCLEDWDPGGPRPRPHSRARDCPQRRQALQPAAQPIHARTEIHRFPSGLGAR